MAENFWSGLAEAAYAVLGRTSRLERIDPEAQRASMNLVEFSEPAVVAHSIAARICTEIQLQDQERSP